MKVIGIVVFLALLSVVQVESYVNTKYAKEMGALPLGSILGGALDAAVTGSETAADMALRFIYSTFSNDTGEFISKNIKFSYKKTNEDGTDSVSELSVPLLTLVPIPMIIVESLNVKMNFNIETTAQVTYGDKIEAEAKFNRRGHYGLQGNVAIQDQLDATASRKRTYSLVVEMNAEKGELSPGASAILNALTDSIK